MRSVIIGIGLLVSSASYAAPLCNVSLEVSTMKAVFTNKEPGNLNEDCVSAFIDSKGRVTVQGRELPVQLNTLTATPGCDIQKIVDALDPALVSKLKVSISKDTSAPTPNFTLVAEIAP